MAMSDCSAAGSPCYRLAASGHHKSSESAYSRSAGNDHQIVLLAETWTPAADTSSRASDVTAPQRQHLKSSALSRRSRVVSSEPERDYFPMWLVPTGFVQSVVSSDCGQFRVWSAPTVVSSECSEL